MYLGTERLILRDFASEDFDGLWDIFRDRETMEHVYLYTEEETRAFLLGFCMEGEPRKACAVVLRESGTLIGYLLRKEIDAPGIYELGWIFHRAYWRRGYAYEAASALIRHLFEKEGAHKVMAETEDPVKSLGLMKKLGMTQEGLFRRHCRTGDGRWLDLYWYGLLAEDWDP